MAGIEVIEARLNYLAYAPEIAAVMLRRQQASAIIAAREKIVEGAVSMVKMALDKLKEENIVDLSEEKKASMVGNLLVVLCADEAAQPVLNTGSEEKKALEAEGKEVNQISASQMSFDNRIENFDRLIMLLSSIPLYNPNEEELKVETLKALHNQLKEKNSEVILPIVQLSNSRITRNTILYKENTGLVDIALDSKTYIKSVFGATSPQYKQVSRLYFKNRE
jgi:hypothetical protein